MTSWTSGWIIWNANNDPFSTPDFQPKQIYPPALQMAELTETVYATQAEAQAAINAHGGPHNYHAATAAGGLGAGVVGPAGGAAQSVTSDAGTVAGFLAKLGTRALWIRIAKVVVGIALAVVGVIQLTRITRVVGPAAAKAALLA